MFELIIHGNNEFQNSKTESFGKSFEVKNRLGKKEKIKFKTIQSINMVSESPVTVGFTERTTIWTALWLISGVTFLPLIGFGLALHSLKPKTQMMVKFEIILEDGRIVSASINQDGFEKIQNMMYKLHGNVEGSIGGDVEPCHSN